MLSNSNTTQTKAGLLYALSLFFVYALSVNVSMAESFDGDVARAMFTTKLKNNEPLNEVLIIENTVRKIYFFSAVKGMQGKTITHRWETRGDKVFEQRFKVSTNSENLISQLELDPSRVGEWMVVMSDEKGWPVKAVMFKYVKQGSFAGKGVIPLKP